MGEGSPATQIDLTEFERLRGEIDSRTQLANQLVLAELTALGAGISFLDKVPDVLVGLAIVSSFLWLLWLDHTVQVYKIAAYIGRQLAPRLQAQHRGAEVLGWERFLRVIDSGGEEAARILFGRQIKEAVALDLPPTRQVGQYIRLLFGGTAPFLLLAYVLFVLRHPLERFFQYVAGAPGASDRVDVLATLRVVSLLLAVGIWLYALYTHREVERRVKILNQALSGAAPSAPDGPPPAPAADGS